MYYWDRAYEYIRKINVFLSKMQESDVQMNDKDQLIGEARFLRAFIYFNLIERFGGVPIVDEVYQLGDEVQFTRSTFDECVTFIEQDITAAKAVLPDKYSSTDAKYGRASGVVCQALLSRVYLYAASPLFSPTKSQQKWQKAADAAEALLNKGFALYSDYNKLFQMSQGAANDEVIFSRGFTTANGHQGPMHNFNRRYEGYGGWWGSNGPSANLIDSYDMINGEPAFLPDGSVNPASGYDPTQPFKNRDPRFEATILHDDMYFRGDHFEMWIAEDGASWGYDSYKATGDNPRTNTVLLKFMPEQGPFNWQTQFTIQWPFFRIAEIYLNYAEAKFELGDEVTAREYVNKVRRRASVNLPDIPATVTGEDLRRRIYNERRIELAFENHRFFDVDLLELLFEYLLCDAMACSCGNILRRTACCEGIHQTLGAEHNTVAVHRDLPAHATKGKRAEFGDINPKSLGGHLEEPATCPGADPTHRECSRYPILHADCLVVHPSDIYHG